jgi:RNA polymerase sigma-70 factor (ECF subfamily)
MPESADDFRVLVARVQLGDEDALLELTQRYEPEVRLAARVLLSRFLRTHLDSVDLVQSVHHTLMLGLRHNKFALTTPQQLLGLAVTMVRRKIARHWRKLQRQQHLDIHAAETCAGQDQRTCPSSTEADPARTAEYNDMLRHLCSQLDERDRRVIELRLQGYSTAEVARQLGLDADVLRVRLSRLRRRLRESNVLTDWL